MKIYISGKISGLPIKNVIEKFKWHAGFLELKGHEPINPIDVSPFDESKDWHDYMVDDIAALLKCDAIYMLKDWGQSRGARIEYQIAKELGLQILFEGEYNADNGRNYMQGLEFGEAHCRAAENYLRERRNARPLPPDLTYSFCYKQAFLSKLTNKYNTMKKEKIKEVLNSMFASIENDQIELYEKLINEKCFDKIGDFEDFYFSLIYPHEQFISGLIKSEISKNNDVAYLLKNSRFIEHNFRYWIEKKEGSACCADKTRTILKRLIEFYKNGTRIEFDYAAEYTFHLPKVIFKTHESIIEFYEGVKGLRYGDPTKYLNALKSLIENVD